MSMVDELQHLAEEVKVCRACPLSESATQMVFSDGNPLNRLVIIGEAPGAEEDRQGKPFVGRAGQLLNRLLSALGKSRNDIYICNILKHRPPDNRNPLPAEIRACTPFLNRQLEIIQPRLIITLGNFSTRFILNTKEGITTLRGHVSLSPQGYPVLPTYHPAAVLRNPNLTPVLQADLAQAFTLPDADKNC